MSYNLIYTTVSGQEEAKKIAGILIEEKLIACANFFPISSIYQWKGKVEESKEAGMFLKTKEELVEEAIKRVKELHSYEVPCIVCLGIEKGNKEFLDWVGKETK